MTIEGLNIRDANNDDYDALMALEQKVIEVERPFNPLLKQQGAHYYDLKVLIADKNSRLIVGEVSGHIIGTGYLQIRDSKFALEHEQHGYLGFMFVAEAYRGHGLNKAILQALVSWGKAQGIDHFYLDVYAQNSSAVRAYEKFGFKPSMLEMTLTVE